MTTSQYNIMISWTEVSQSLILYHIENEEMVKRHNDLNINVNLSSSKRFLKKNIRKISFLGTQLDLNV